MANVPSPLLAPKSKPLSRPSQALGSLYVLQVLLTETVEQNWMRLPFFPVDLLQNRCLPKRKKFGHGAVVIHFANLVKTFREVLGQLEISNRRGCKTTPLSLLGRASHVPGPTDMPDGALMTLPFPPLVV